jgi:hypothetical protein
MGFTKQNRGCAELIERKYASHMATRGQRNHQDIFTVGFAYMRLGKTKFDTGHQQQAIGGRGS